MDRDQDDHTDDEWTTQQYGVYVCDGRNIRFSGCTVRNIQPEEDVDTYLALLKTTGEYFDSLIRFEREKSEAGLFMPDYAADQVAEQCQAFIDMGNSNYLYSTFADRIEDVDELDEKEKSDYIQDNALVVSDNIIPASRGYTGLIQG